MHFKRPCTDMKLPTQTSKFTILEPWNSLQISTLLLFQLRIKLFYNHCTIHLFQITLGSKNKSCYLTCYIVQNLRLLLDLEFTENTCISIKYPLPSKRSREKEKQRSTLNLENITSFEFALASFFFTWFSLINQAKGLVGFLWRKKRQVTILIRYYSLLHVRHKSQQFYVSVHIGFCPVHQSHLETDIWHVLWQDK